MSSLFYQQCPAQGPIHIASHQSIHMYQPKRSVSQLVSPPHSYSMESYSTAEEAALYQMSTVQGDADPRLSISTHANSFVLPIHPAPRRSNASVEHWLTTESPIARATNFDSHQHPQNPYRLPSLPETTFLPENLDCTTDTKHDMSAMEGFAMPDVPYGQSAHLQMSEVDTVPQHVSPPATWNMQDDYYSTSSPTTPLYSSRDIMVARGMVPPGSPYSSLGYLDESPMYSPCSSAPELYRPMSAERQPGPCPSQYAHGLRMHIPRSLPQDDEEQDDEEEVVGGKPYAQLIQECLLQAPGHRMMLRDIYDWFERNTTKPRESGGNGWQNSIRHNLSMNKAFENDKKTVTNARGEPKKATSVWFLTDHALRHGVQSTTRYRKNNTARKSAYNRDIDWKRQHSGSRGGKASRKATQMRRLGVGAWASHIPAAELAPFDHLVNAANMMGDYYPGTRGSSPMSPSDNYPCTPRSPTHQDYSTEMEGGFGCHGGDISYHDVQLQDALCQAGYGSGEEMMW